MLQPQYSLPQFRRSDLDQRVRSPHVGNLLFNFVQKIENKTQFQVKFVVLFSLHNSFLDRYFVSRSKSVTNSYFETLSLLKELNQGCQKLLKLSAFTNQLQKQRKAMRQQINVQLLQSGGFSYQWTRTSICDFDQVSHLIIFIGVPIVEI
ncbi:Hypothetical_protein [Hexamita inflata]|uniref:Hypothetical_protein n=1 Tax=Hexamita inflata TaxID=28002 RepID=A0AA86NGY1_9EUKA|nr:Hypothetical protein HINF_LOCUS6590 [Hexamita inflata]